MGSMAYGLMLDPLLGKHGSCRGVFGAYKSSDMDATCVSPLAERKLFDLIVQCQKLSSVVCGCVCAWSKVSVTTLVQLFKVLRKRIPGRHLPKLWHWEVWQVCFSHWGVLLCCHAFPLLWVPSCIPMAPGEIWNRWSTRYLLMNLIPPIIPGDFGHGCDIRAGVECCQNLPSALVNLPCLLGHVGTLSPEIHWNTLCIARSDSKDWGGAWGSVQGVSKLFRQVACLSSKWLVTWQKKVTRDYLCEWSS